LGLFAADILTVVIHGAQKGKIGWG